MAEAKAPRPTAPGGIFVISLDFELHWGVCDHRSVEDYQVNLRGTRAAITEMLGSFRSHGVHATWATVGFLLCEGRKDLESVMPRRLPRYKNAALDPYTRIPSTGSSEDTDPFHFAPSAVREIIDSPGQELATHTFSHFYACEDGADDIAFAADLEASAVLMERYGASMKSIVFPRNRYNARHLRICGQLGIETYRRNEASSLYDFESPLTHTQSARVLRLLDSYLPLTPTNVGWPELEVPFPVPSTRFLRPNAKQATPARSRAAAIPQQLKLRRILASMREASRNDGLFHLWWHPHNFGANLESNLLLLEEILCQFDTLQAVNGMRSMNMIEVKNALVGGQ